MVAAQGLRNVGELIAIVRDDTGCLGGLLKTAKALARARPGDWPARELDKPHAEDRLRCRFDGAFNICTAQSMNRGERLLSTINSLAMGSPRFTAPGMPFLPLPARGPRRTRRPSAILAWISHCKALTASGPHTNVSLYRLAPHPRFCLQENHSIERGELCVLARQSPPREPSGLQDLVDVLDDMVKAAAGVATPQEGFAMSRRN
jgi:hypothetical protein